VHRVELTAAGEAAFERWRAVALTFDLHMRKAATKSELETLSAILGKLRARAEGSRPTQKT
jgi:hypothetical protein